ncbi:MAG: DUF1499 domain-containing protein [Pseudomonadota bacterium]
MKNVSSVLLTLGLVIAVSCLLGALFGGLGSRFGWWDFSLGFTILRYSVYAAGAAAALAVLSGIFTMVGGQGLRLRHFVVLAIAAIVFGVPYQARNEFRKVPTIADATTDFDNAPVFVDLVAVREQTAKNPLEFRGGETIERQKASFPELKTLHTSMSPEQVIAAAQAIAETQGWEVVAAKKDEGRLEATATTFWFGFKDDIVVRAVAAEDGQTIVDARSASRVGFLDGGANAKRVEILMNGLDAS